MAVQSVVRHRPVDGRGCQIAAVAAESDEPDAAGDCGQRVGERGAQLGTDARGVAGPSGGHQRQSGRRSSTGSITARTCRSEPPAGADPQPRARPSATRRSPRRGLYHGHRRRSSGTWRLGRGPGSSVGHVGASTPMSSIAWWSWRRGDEPRPDPPPSTPDEVGHANCSSLTRENVVRMRLRSAHPAPGASDDVPRCRTEGVPTSRRGGA
jgi:hypothetical protein